jgi:predicted enzyme related to lactoylglutathione lyase
MTGRAVVEVAIFTDEVEAVRAFYESVLGVAPEAEWPGGAVFSAGDVNRACDELRAGGIDVLVPPRDYPWGRSAYLRDPDGRILELSQT